MAQRQTYTTKVNHIPSFQQKMRESGGASICDVTIPCPLQHLAHQARFPQETACLSQTRCASNYSSSELSRFSFRIPPRWQSASPRHGGVFSGNKL